MAEKSNTPKWLVPTLVGLIIVLIAAAFFLRKAPETPSPLTSPVPEASLNPSDPLATPAPSPSPSVLPGEAAVPPSPIAGAVNLAVDAQGLSNATAVIQTEKGVIKFKFYTNDAPATVQRIVELIRQGFYNGLTFWRVVPGFVIQGGDPTGTGGGGSGTKLKAEFNSRRHIEGTVAMARTQDPDSADSQFYISMGVHPNLDRNYTVFGQVISGMDVVRRITKNDRMISVTIE